MLSLLNGCKQSVTVLCVPSDAEASPGSDHSIACNFEAEDPSLSPH